MGNFPLEASGNSKAGCLVQETGSASNLQKYSGVTCLIYSEVINAQELVCSSHVHFVELPRDAFAVEKPVHRFVRCFQSAVKQLC